jgi:hypothetical protein
VLGGSTNKFSPLKSSFDNANCVKKINAKR